MNTFLGIALLIATVAKQLGLSLTVASSTYALIFYFQSLRDGTVDDTEKRFLHTVFFVLRLGWALFAAGEIILLAFIFSLGTPLSAVSDTIWMTWLIFGVLLLNAYLMTKHIMPMRFGPALAGGSWYSIFFLNVLPFGNFHWSFLILGYVIFLAVFFGILEIIRKQVTTHNPQPTTNPNA